MIRESQILGAEARKEPLQQGELSCLYPG